MNSEEPKQLDHKAIGIQMELFFTDPIAPGAPFWLPKGMIIFKELEKYIRELTAKAGYQETSTPIMVKSDLFKQSGHWTKFGSHNMYNLALYEDEEIEAAKGKELPVNYSLKPMNCPESTVLYRFRNRSYRELPLRLSEIGRLHRREKSGEVNGLLRVRQLTMDDAHIFATEEQILPEITSILEMMMEFYDRFGFSYEFKLATRPEEFAGTEKNWQTAEKDLEEALISKKLKYSIKDRDGAFYGPKIDVHIKDSLGREWQLATVQLDFHQPEAFDLKYTDNDGKEKRPVMIHRAIFGSFERFIGILTEHYGGNYPTWLTPIQAVVLPITDSQSDYAQKVKNSLAENGVRVQLDSRGESLQARIRDGELMKIPYILVAGGREAENDTISIRKRGVKEQTVKKIDEFINDIRDEISFKK